MWKKYTQNLNAWDLSLNYNSSLSQKDEYLNIDLHLRITH